MPTNRNAIVAAATVVLVSTIAAIIVVTIMVEDPARVTQVIGSLATLLTTGLGFLALFVKAEQTDKKLERVEEQTTRVEEQTLELTNGLGDAKMRAAVADILPDELIDPAALEQLERDRERRRSAAQASAAILRQRLNPDEVADLP